MLSPRAAGEPRAAGDQPIPAGSRLDAAGDQRIPAGYQATPARGAAERGSEGGSGNGVPIEVSGRYLGLMRLEEFSRLPTPEDDDKSYLRGNRSVNGLWSDGATLWVADGMSSQARLRGLDCPENAATSSEGCGVELGPEVPTGSRLTDDGRTLYFDTIPALTAYDLAGGHRIRSRDLPNTSTYVYEDSGFGANPGGGGARDGLVKPDGVWSDGTTIWVSDVSRVVKAYKVSSFAERTSTEAVAKLLPDRSLTMPTRSVPRGIWSDGTTIWVVDAFRDERVGVNRRPKMVAFDLANGDRDDSRDITGLNGTPEGVWSDGVTMWVSTSPSSVSEGSRPGRDKVLAYWFNPEGGPAERDPGRDLKLATRTASGLWSDGEQMWVGDGGSGVHVYCLDSAASCHDAPPRSTDATTALVYAAGNIELASAIEQPTGIWSDGTTLYVAETDTNKIYRYTVDGEAQGTALALATGNTEPKGLWSDGTTMWVADSLDKKLYAYTLEPLGARHDQGSQFAGPRSRHGSGLSVGQFAVGCVVGRFHHLGDQRVREPQFRRYQGQGHGVQHRRRVRER